MRIGIVGSGHIGGTLAKLFARVGYEVAISNSRGPASLVSIVAEIGPQARAATVDEAIAFGDVVVLAIPYGEYQALPLARLKGKIVIDAMNYYSQRDGVIDFGDLTSTELIARHIPDGRVLKAFNTMYYETLATKGNPSAPLDDRLVIFVSGDSPDARSTARATDPGDRLRAGRSGLVARGRPETTAGLAHLQPAAHSRGGSEASRNGLAPILGPPRVLATLARFPGECGETRTLASR